MKNEIENNLETEGLKLVVSHLEGMASKYPDGFDPSSLNYMSGYSAICHEVTITEVSEEIAKLIDFSGVETERGISCEITHADKKFSVTFYIPAFGPLKNKVCACVKPL